LTLRGPFLARFAQGQVAGSLRFEPLSNCEQISQISNSWQHCALRYQSAMSEKARKKGVRCYHLA
ncbi:hypothetical protein, partial [Marivita geojedonensis]|uniref:hypothetical protein n=1 Tax=Marivita geojedonensis TaxID=1123756 RepID=UPI001E42C3A1